MWLCTLSAVLEWPVQVYRCIRLVIYLCNTLDYFNLEYLFTFIATVGRIGQFRQILQYGVKLSAYVKHLASKCNQRLSLMICFRSHGSSSTATLGSFGVLLSTIHFRCKTFYPLLTVNEYENQNSK